MDSVHDALFSPFKDPTKYCWFFYTFGMYYLAAFIFGLFSLVITRYNKKMGKLHYVLAIAALMVKLFVYAECRLLYSMCIGFDN